MGNKKMALRRDAAREEEGWRDWSALTEPLLLCIISLFTTLQDFFAFRGACRRWRSIAIPNQQTMSSQSPLLLLYRYVGFFNTRSRSLFDIAHGRHYLILPPNGDILGCSDGHLIVHVQNGKSSHIALVNLFTGFQTMRLPTRQSILKPHRLRLSSSPSSPGCLVVFQPKKFKDLDYCHIAKPKRSFLGEWKQWAKYGVEDILFFNNRLYVLTRLLQLWVLDTVSSPWKLVLLESTSPVPEEANCRRCDRYLAESDGELLMVCKECRDCGSKVCFIWKWSSQSGGGWVAVSNLGSRSLFIGLRGFVGSVPIPERSNFKHNCIYILERNCDGVMYSLEEGRFRVLPWALPYLDKKVESPLWILPNVI